MTCYVLFTFIEVERTMFILLNSLFQIKLHKLNAYTNGCNVMMTTLHPLVYELNEVIDFEVGMYIFVFDYS